MTDRLTLVTGNPDKAKLLEKYLGIPVESAALDLDEIQSLNVREIIEKKAREAYRQLNKPVVVDDVSFVIDDLNGLPGPFIKWFSQSLGYEGLCRLADSSVSREATIEVALGYFDGTTFMPFVGTSTGTIAEHAKGERGFGFDAIFICDGYKVTRGEMSEADYHKTSARRMAIELLKGYLEQK